MSIEKLIAQNAATARELWLESLPESVTFTESPRKSEKTPSFLFGKAGKILTAICLCLTLSIVSIAEEEPNRIDISFDAYDDGYKISFDSNFEERMAWKNISFGYLPEGYQLEKEYILDNERTYNFGEIADEPNPYTGKSFSISIMKMDRDNYTCGVTHDTSFIPEESHMEIGGNNSLVLTLGITTSIYMPKENYVVTVTGSMPKADLIKIAENISFEDSGQTPPPEPQAENTSTLLRILQSPSFSIPLFHIALCLAAHLALTVYENRKGGKK